MRHLSNGDIDGPSSESAKITRLAIRCGRNSVDQFYRWRSSSRSIPRALDGIRICAPRQPYACRRSATSGAQPGSPGTSEQPRVSRGHRMPRRHRILQICMTMTFLLCYQLSGQSSLSFVKAVATGAKGNGQSCPVVLAGLCDPTVGCTRQCARNMIRSDTNDCVTVTDLSLCVLRNGTSVLHDFEAGDPHPSTPSKILVRSPKNSTQVYTGGEIKIRWSATLDIHAGTVSIR